MNQIELEGERGVLIFTLEPYRSDHWLRTAKYGREFQKGFRGLYVLFSFLK